MGAWDLTKDFHGRYCGAGNRRGVPVDPCDACCAQHDACYEVHGHGMMTPPAARAPCDVPFIKCLRATDGCPWLKRQAMIAVFDAGLEAPGDSWEDPRVLELMERWRQDPAEAPRASPGRVPCLPVANQDFEPTSEEYALEVLEAPQWWQARACCEEEDC